MLELPEIMKTETFWAPVVGAMALFSMIALILIDRWRRPKVYLKKGLSKKEAKITDSNIPDQAA